MSYDTILKIALGNYEEATYELDVSYPRHLKEINRLIEIAKTRGAQHSDITSIPGLLTGLDTAIEYEMARYAKFSEAMTSYIKDALVRDALVAELITNTQTEISKKDASEWFKDLHAYVEAGGFMAQLESWLKDEEITALFVLLSLLDDDLTDDEIRQRIKEQMQYLDVNSDAYKFLDEAYKHVEKLRNDPNNAWLAKLMEESFSELGKTGGQEFLQTVIMETDVWERFLYSKLGGILPTTDSIFNTAFNIADLALDAYKSGYIDGKSWEDFWEDMGSALLSAGLTAAAAAAGAALGAKIGGTGGIASAIVGALVGAAVAGAYEAVGADIVKNLLQYNTDLGHHTQWYNDWRNENIELYEAFWGA